MQKNLLLAVLLSIAVVTLWDIFVLRPLTPPPSQVRHFAGEAPASNEPVKVSPQETMSATKKNPAPELLFLKTDTNRVILSNLGASVESWMIKANGDWVEMVLKSPGSAGIALSTFDSLEFKGRALESGAAIFEGTDVSGARIVKRLLLGPRFLHHLELELENPTPRAVGLTVPFGWSAGLGTDSRAALDNIGDMRAVAYDGRRALSLPTGTHAGRYGWFGVDNKYFLTAVIPESGTESTLNVEAPKRQPPRLEDEISVHLQPGEKRTLSFQFYLGPKSSGELEAAGSNLSASENFGVFGGIAKVLFWVLQRLDRLTGNYGWSIIILTVLLQILLLPLTMHSYRHSVRMRELQPQIKALQERFKGDPKRMNVEVMNLYKKNGLKFMGMEGCFPMLLQIPFFYAFYAVLRTVYELRGAPWLGWVKDLSVRDPYYVLPVLMGAGMLAQQKIGGAVSTDPAQARMMALMPIFLSFVFAKLPSGYLLYWFTNSLVTIAIQGWMRWRDSVKESERAVAGAP